MSLGVKMAKDYQEGVEDGLKIAEKTHIPLNDVLETFDKFLDKISYYKKTLKEALTYLKTLEQNNQELTDLVYKLEAITKGESKNESPRGKQE